MNNLKTIAIYMACVSVAFSEAAFCLDEELKSGYVISNPTETTETRIIHPCRDKDETIQFQPKLSYLEAGDCHCTVEFFIQLFQTSTNFFSYGFARNPKHNRIEKLKICFLDASGKSILTIPCIVTGNDMIWGMDGTRVVQIYGEFIMTHGRCDYLNGKASKFYLKDGNGNLLDQSENIIEINLSDRDLDAMIYTPLKIMERNSGSRQ